MALDSLPSLHGLNHTCDLEKEGLWIVAHALSLVTQAWEEGDWLCLWFCTYILRAELGRCAGITASLQAELVFSFWLLVCLYSARQAFHLQLL